MRANVQNLQMTRKTTPVGINFPNAALKALDEERGAVPRSRFVVGLLEKYYDEKRDGGAATVQQQQAPAKKRPVSRTVANQPSLGHACRPSRGEML